MFAHALVGGQLVGVEHVLLGLCFRKNFVRSTAVASRAKVVTLFAFHPRRVVAARQAVLVTQTSATCWTAHASVIARLAKEPAVGVFSQAILHTLPLVVAIDGILVPCLGRGHRQGKQERPKSDSH